MKHCLLFFFLVIFFLSCSSPSGVERFDQNFHEAATKIKFPAPFIVVTTHDNSEYCVVSILDLSRTDCNRFAKENNFVKLELPNPETYFTLRMLDSNYRKFPDEKRLLINYHGKEYGKAGWIYLLDTVDCRLYCEIDYPDMGGN